MEVTMFRLFAVLQREAARSPMENMENMVSSHAPINAGRLPPIR